MNGVSRRLGDLARLNRLKARFFRGPFRGMLDQPLEAATAAGVLELAGWVFSTAAPLTGLEAFLDDTFVGKITYGLQRPDVAKIYPHATSSGYAARLVLDPTLTGSKRLTVRATDAQGHRQNYNRIVRLTPPAARLYLDSPPPGLHSGGLLPIEGWAFSPNAPIVRVEAFIEGLPPEKLVYGLSRPDLKLLQPGLTGEDYGFRGLLTFEPTDYNPPILSVKATDGLGETVEAQVILGPPAIISPKAEIELAEWRAGLLQVAGWAVGISGPPLARFFINDRLIGETRFDLSRPDIGARFPTLPAAQRCGFRFRQFVGPFADEVADPLWLRLEFGEAARPDLRRSVLLAAAQTTFSADPASQTLWTDFQAGLAEYRRRIEGDPVILDWDSGLKLAAVLPIGSSFSPPLSGEAVLPYVAQSLDLVVLNSSDAARAVEARRVATKAVLNLVEGSKLEWCGPEPELITSEQVSIVIPVYNKIDYTQACLEQLLKTLPPSFTGEILVVDDASTDNTAAVLAEFTRHDQRIKILRNAQNAGFIDSCNRGAAAATGDTLIFLNNDTLPQSNWLPPLLHTLRTAPDAGAVGGKLIYPDGSLQEAGGVIFSDGTGYNFGREDKAANAGLYNYLREVDYCSGALLATRRALFQELDGFDSRYRPAYYEDTDYCFALRNKGYKVYYQPESCIVHFEGISSGRDVTRGVKQYQLVNQAHFAEKWATALTSQPPPPQRLDFENLQRWAVRDGATKRALVCAARMPEYDREGGLQRVFHFIEFLREAGWAVSFIAHNATEGERYARRLQQMGVATYAGPSSQWSGDNYLANTDRLIEAGRFDLALIASWDVAEIYLPALRSLSPQTQIIVDSIDLHFLRRARSLLRPTEGSPSPGKLDEHYAAELVRELNIYARADAVLTVSTKEAGLINDLNATSGLAFAVADREVRPATTLPAAQRKGLLFVGNFRHPPNIEAVKYLCQAILPRLDPTLLAAHPLYIVGNGLDEKIIALAAGLPNVHLVGWVPDLAPYFAQSRLSLIPLLSGAGTKRKLIQSLMAATPAVATSIGVEGLNLQSGEHVLVADDPVAFVTAISQLLHDTAQWEKLAQAGQTYIVGLHGPEVVRQRFWQVIEAVLNRRHVAI